MKLNAVNEEGVEFPLLTPFFEALWPAFEDHADEIRIEPADSGLKLTYGGNTVPVPLPDVPHYYPMVAFPRILILSGLIIALEGAEQTGQFRVRYGQEFLTVQVTSRRDTTGWFLIFRPSWKTVTTL